MTNQMKDPGHLPSLLTTKDTIEPLLFFHSKSLSATYEMYHLPETYNCREIASLLAFLAVYLPLVLQNIGVAVG